MKHRHPQGVPLWGTPVYHGGMDRWLYRIDDRVEGPATTEDLIRLAENGDIQPETLIVLVGQSNWTQAADHDDGCPPPMAAGQGGVEQHPFGDEAPAGR